ncbi:putative lipase [Venturia inaequalis]|nr:putative lipase [Venturia inaequalis]
MPRASHRSEQASAFFAAVYAAVSEVPYGKVTSYAQIARLVGKRESTFSFLRGFAINILR